MIMNHEVYMGEILLETIKNELGGGDFVWYKAEMIYIPIDETYKERIFYLTEHNLIETRTTAKEFTIKKYSKDAIIKVGKEFSIIEKNLTLEKVTIHFGDNEDDYLYLTRPKEIDGGDIKGYNELTKRL